MKIAYVAASIIPSWTANSVQVMKVCQALHQNGEDVHLFVPGDRSTAWTDLRAHYGISDEFPIHWLTFTPLVKKLDFILAALRKIKNQKFDLVYTRLLWAAWLASLQGLPVVLEVHDRPVGKMGPSLFKCFLRSKHRKRVVLITDALRNILEKEYRLILPVNQTLIAPDGVDLERFSNKLESYVARARLDLEERFTAAYSGGFYEGRGLESLMHLAGKFPEVQFLWVGGKQDVVENWRNKLTDAGLRNIHLTGFVPNELLPLYQMAADILLMPYGKVIAGSSGGNIADVSSPMKMFEYMAAGRVILTSDMPVLLEVLNNDNAAFYHSEDVEGLEKSFERLMQDEGLRRRLAARAMADVENYSWRERMRKIIVSLDRS